jgi:hypothetical protein
LQLHLLLPLNLHLHLPLQLDFAHVERTLLSAALAVVIDVASLVRKRWSRFAPTSSAHLLSPPLSFAPPSFAPPSFALPWKSGPSGPRSGERRKPLGAVLALPPRLKPSRFLPNAGLKAGSSTKTIDKRSLHHHRHPFPFREI